MDNNQLRELDKWIAENVLNIPKELISIQGSFNYKREDGSFTLVREIDHYSSNAMSAFELRQKMSLFGWNSKDDLTSTGWGKGKIGYSIWFKKWVPNEGHFLMGNFHVDDHNLAPYAICMAIKMALSSPQKG